MTELKPCPLCGGKAVRMYMHRQKCAPYGNDFSFKGYEQRNFGSDSEKGHVECSKCHLRQRDYSTLRIAVSAWNKRAKVEDDD